MLERALQRDRLGHALLLHGPRFEQLETVALALADALLDAGGDPRRHPDFFTLRPARKGRQIQVGERKNLEPNTMRSLLKDLHQSGHQSDCRVAVIYEADRMNDSTANAFLKTLEEPPPGAIILLLTSRPYDLLDTIYSRCLNFRLAGEGSSLASEAWAQWLADYRQWLERPKSGASAPDDRAALVFGAYGLTSRFLAILKSEAHALWKTEADRLPDAIDPEERESLETGFRKGVRSRFLADIERVTRDFATAESADSPERFQQLGEAVYELERMAGLLEVNLKDEAALEGFFLASLRIWTTPR